MTRIPPSGRKGAVASGIVIRELELSHDLLSFVVVFSFVADLAAAQADLQDCVDSFSADFTADLSARAH